MASKQDKRYVVKDMLYDLCQPSGVCRLHVSMIDQMPAVDLETLLVVKEVREELQDIKRRVDEACAFCKALANKNKVGTACKVCPLSGVSKNASLA